MAASSGSRGRSPWVGSPCPALEWGNGASEVATIEVPAGTTLYEGIAASQGNVPGGGSQVFIPESRFSMDSAVMNPCILMARGVPSREAVSELLGQLKAAVAAGVLVQLVHDDPLFGPNPKLADIADAGPWPDYLELHFVTSDNTSKYRLAVETYHGTGGAWTRE